MLIYSIMGGENGMRLINMVSVSICCILVISCAQRSANIAPAHISAARYADWDCKRLLDEKTYVDSALPTASSQQDAAADSDAMMVRLGNHAASPLATEVIEYVDITGVCCLGNAKQDAIEALSAWGARFRSYHSGYNREIVGPR